ncbi:ABC transporter ATP-binding protein [Numidum massiliense]|uniref:ABC transporter ATP-binding protein n=1 Tax=Numidum massiliense TaxID=1522315 RepID=UPI0006D5B646|nr:ABC transporter ATP-binding protein [Numidum massiliense]
MTVLRAESLQKVYGSKKGGGIHKALNDLSISVDAGEFVGVMGPSGSGKTTLLNLLATIAQPTAGTVEINGVDLLQLPEKDLALFRRRQLGFIFQDFNLLDTLSIKENIVLPLVLDNMKVREIERRVTYVARLLDIESILNKRTYEVSGGQQQRTAAARAIIHEPSIVLADEPTGNLDSKSSKDLMEALKNLNKKQRTTILMVTHDPFAASFCERIVFIKDGSFFAEIRKGGKRQAFLEHILDSLALLGGDHSEFSHVRA